jgi:hypothetical protein
MSKLKCVWDMGTDCCDDAEEIGFFDGKVKVPVCSNHIEQHKEVMLLFKNGYDVEDMLQQTAEYRKEQVLILKLSGLDAGEVDL